MMHDTVAKVVRISLKVDMRLGSRDWHRSLLLTTSENKERKNEKDELFHQKKKNKKATLLLMKNMKKQGCKDVNSQWN